jgi:hypothetical protein
MVVVEGVATYVPYSLENIMVGILYEKASGVLEPS